MRLFVGAAGLSWWSPSEVKVTNYCVCSVCVTVLSGIYYSVHLGNEVILPVVIADITSHSKLCNVTRNTDHFKFLCARDPQFFKHQSPTVHKSC